MLVSIYIPTRNRFTLLKRAIASVKEQTYKNIELIVVDDGSSDGTREYLSQEMAAGALRAIFHERSLGACAARNAAIMCAQGEFVTGLDDDDYFLSTRRIEFFIEKWKTAGTDIAGIFDSVQVKTANGTVCRHCAKSASYKQLRQQNIVGNQVFAPRSHYLGAGLFDVDMPAWQDWDLWIRIAEKYGDFIGINKMTYLMDEFHDADRLTTRNGNTIREAMRRLSKKITNISLRERSSVIASLHAYPQIKPRINEIFVLLIAFRLKSVLHSTKKMLT